MAALDAAADAHGPTLRAASALAHTQNPNHAEGEEEDLPLPSSAEAAAMAHAHTPQFAAGDISVLGEEGEDFDGEDDTDVFLTSLAGGMGFGGTGEVVGEGDAEGADHEFEDDDWRPAAMSASAALSALKFALAHPLCEADAGPTPPNHARPTASQLNRMRLVQEERRGAAGGGEVLARGDGGGGGASVRSQVADIDSILQKMKSRLATVEANLATEEDR